MPYRRKRRVYRKRYGRRGRMYKKRYTKKRGVFKRGPPNGGVTTIRSKYGYGNQTLAGVMPGILFTKMAYVQDIGHTVNGNIVVSEFVPNNLFQVFSGQDAQGAVQMNFWYDRWVVTGFSYRIEMMNHSDSQLYRLIALPWCQDEDPLADSDQMAQQTGARTAVIGFGGGSRGVVTMNGYVNMNKLTGVKVTEEEQYWGTQSTGPANPFSVRFYVGTQNINGTSVIQDLVLSIKIVMYTKYWCRKLLDTVNPPALVLAPLALKKRLLIGRTNTKALKGKAVEEKAEEKADDVLDLF